MGVARILAELLVNANSLRLPLADESIDMCVTSPPYYGLRDYGTGAQLGLEESPEQYIENMVAVFREVKRIMKAHGTLWLNIGDSYAGSGRGPTNGINQHGAVGAKHKNLSAETRWRGYEGLKPKDLIGIPWMLAFALRIDGWYLRQDIIWHKPNPMPESVKDRTTKAHEYIFLLSKSRDYYYDAEAIREPSTEFHKDKRAVNGHALGGKYDKRHSSAGKAGMFRPDGMRNKRSVWSIPTASYKGAHFATFPPALIEPCIKAGSSEKGVCPDCGAPKGDAGYTETKTLGWAPTCIHSAEPVPAIVFDPFLGSGTTALVARQLGRHAIGTDISFAYLHEQARARLQLEASYWDGPRQVDGKLDDLPMFGGAEFKPGLGGEWLEFNDDWG